MPINVQKSGVLKFGRPQDLQPLYELQGQKLRFLETERDLGVIMDPTLCYKTHIEKAIGKAMRIYGWITRSLITRESCVIIRTYKSLIRPILEYCSSVWSPSRRDLISNLERVQRKVTKLVFKSYLPYSERLQKLQLPSLQWRRTYLDLLRTHQVVHGNVSIRKQLFKFTSEVSTSTVNLRRHRFSLYHAGVHCELYRNQFANRVITKWNALPDNLLDITQFALFKSKLKQYLLVSIDPYKWEY
jgi:hypothetical protein